MAETQGTETTSTELAEVQKLANGAAALTEIDADLFSTEIKAIDAKKSALEAKDEVEGWFSKHKQDIVNAVMLIAVAYIIFRLTV